MAKKKIELRTSGSSVESGDVNITYNNVRIAGLSESTSAVLETEDNVCKHDIEIEYTKPAGGDIASPKSISLVENLTPEGTLPNFIVFNHAGGLCKIENGAITLLEPDAIAFPGSGAIPTEANYLPIKYFSGEDVYNYAFGGLVYPTSHEDVFDVTCNGEPVAWNNDNQGYIFIFDVNDITDLPNIVIVVSDKTPN